MKERPKWTKVVYIIGVIALIIGTIDPLEGSVVIGAGAGLIALSTYFSNDRHWKIFLTTFLLIVAGVCMLFYLSSLGGFGGNSGLSTWWGALILPYPIGWLISLVTLIVRAFRKPDIKIQ